MRFSTCVFVCFFFKQKTAYEMRISDWSSDVCSSDLGAQPSLLNRLINAWRDIAGSPGSVVRSDLSSDGDRRWLVEQMQSCRSEERRVGKECVSTCRSRWSPYNYTKYNYNSRYYITSELKDT